MHLNVKNHAAHQLAAELAALTGETMTQAVTTALEQRLIRERKSRGRDGIAEKLLAIGQLYRDGTIADDRTPDEIVGYDENGLPA